MGKSIFLLSLLMLSSVVQVKADENLTYYKKITSNRTDWTGEYVIGYDNKFFNCTEMTTNYATKDIDSNFVVGENAVQIEKFNTGYSIKILSGDNENKYMYDTASENAVKFANLLAKVENSIVYNEDETFNIVSGGNTFRYNKTKGQDRFRYYKDTDTSLKFPLVNLYIKYDAREWEKDFNNLLICDPTGTNKPDETIWNKLGQNYSLVCDKENITFAAKERYTYIISKYGYADFMNLGISKNLRKFFKSDIENKNLIIICLNGAGIIGLIWFIKRRVIA